MQRESNVQTLNWADKTMSVLRLQQLEACEKRLSACLSFGLFSDCDDVRVEELWETSYEAGEQGVLTEGRAAGCRGGCGGGIAAGADVVLSAQRGRSLHPLLAGSVKGAVADGDGKPRA